MAAVEKKIRAQARAKSNEFGGKKRHKKRLTSKLTRRRLTNTDGS